MISVVVPIYNEADIVAELHTRLSTVLGRLGAYEILFVNDGSTDASLSRLVEIRSKDSNVVVIELSRNYGQTAALAAGIDSAKGETIITMDGDLQHEPEEIPRFLSKLSEGFDIVSGWREIRTDNVWLRRIPSKVANWLMSYLSGVEVKDLGSTFKAYRAELLKKLELFGELHRFIPILAHRMGARIAEISITVHPRTKGSSKYGIKRTLGVFEDIIFLEFYSNYLTKPIRAFGKLFMLFFGVGFSIALGLMGLWLVGIISAVIEHAALLLFSVFTMTIGIQFLALGVLAELLSRIYLHTSNSKIYSIRKIH